jgi:hypothetical protein
MANRRGITINVGSASSTLSRFKSDNIVRYDGERYRLSEYVRDPVQPVAQVVEHPAAWTKSA